MDGLTGAETDSGAESADSDGGEKFDVGDSGDGDGDSCTVPPGHGDGVPACEDEAPADAFDPVIEWTYGEGEWEAIVTPLVANLTDDDGNGTIDLCDVPDIVLVAGPHGSAGGRTTSAANIHILDGATGTPHLIFDTPVLSTFTPALGDIDDDGEPEIVTVLPSSAEKDGDPHGDLVAFDADGSVLWQTPVSWPIDLYLPQSMQTGAQYGASAALADLDTDGDVEIIVAGAIFDHEGQLVTWYTEYPTVLSTPTAADLDGDGDLEVVQGHCAYQHDGTVLFCDYLPVGHAAIADLDADGEAELMISDRFGLTLRQHDGTELYVQERPTGDPGTYLLWDRPAAIHDFDGDGEAEYAVSSANHYVVYEHDASIVWNADVSDQTGAAAGTAFDFLGDGSAEAMYADENTMYVFDAQGNPIVTGPRTSRTLTEYPIVADVDNDGSAEILFVSDPGLDDAEENAPALVVMGDAQDRWIQARRIWNQHTYHVTNVREDGTIPQDELPVWHGLNTFRTQAQLGADGEPCQPEPPKEG
jgi:hypothetical protein